MGFFGMVLVKKMYKGVQIKILEGVKPNDYSITILESEGGQAKWLQLITIGGGGSKKTQKMIT